MFSNFRTTSRSFKLKCSINCAPFLASSSSTRFTPQSSPLKAPALSDPLKCHNIPLPSPPAAPLSVFRRTFICPEQRYDPLKHNNIPSASMALAGGRGAAGRLLAALRLLLLGALCLELGVPVTRVRCCSCGACAVKTKACCCGARLRCRGLHVLLGCGLGGFASLDLGSLLRALALQAVGGDQSLDLGALRARVRERGGGEGGGGGLPWRGSSCPWQCDR